MRYSEAYIQSKDIDWFCFINGIPVHVASAGGMLPKAINDREKLRGIQHQVHALPNIFSDEEIIVNQQLLQQRFSDNEEARRNYLRSFLAMARKGFVSMDRTVVEDITNNHYHVVCMPSSIKDIVEVRDIQHFRCENAGFLETPTENIPLLTYLHN